MTTTLDRIKEMGLWLEREGCSRCVLQIDKRTYELLEAGQNQTNQSDDFFMVDAGALRVFVTY